MKLRTVSCNGWPAWKMQKYSELYSCLAYWKWGTSPPVCYAAKGVSSEYQVLFQNANLRKVCNLYIWFSVSIVETSLKHWSQSHDCVYTGLREQSETRKIQTINHINYQDVHCYNSHNVYKFLNTESWIILCEKILKWKKPLFYSLITKWIVNTYDIID